MIDRSDIPYVETILKDKGYTHTFFQITRPKQVFGLVKEINYEGMVIDHHIRCYTNGKITTEIELRRLKDWWLHLTSHSISAHERVINILEKEFIEYSIDPKLRQRFKDAAPHEFSRDYLEFFRWLIYGVCFWIPLSYIWRFSVYLKSFLPRRKPEPVSIVKTKVQPPPLHHSKSSLEFGHNSD